jgi:pantoate--beta-alanine ligase
MSSRNAYLKPDERVAATILYRSLEHVERLYKSGERKADVLRRALQETLGTEPLAVPDYVSVAHIDTLKELETVDDKALVSLAVRFGATRLIDNTVLPPGQALY